VSEARVAYGKAQTEVAQRERQTGSEVESARDAVEKARRELEILEKSNAVELETAQKELEHQRLLEESAQIECKRQQRLGSPEVGLVSRQQVEQAERSLRAASFAVSVAEKALTLMKERQTSQMEQKRNQIASAEFKLRSAEAAQKPGSQRGQEGLLGAKKRLERAERDVADATMKAPVAGTVVLGAYRDYATRIQRPLKVADSVGSGDRIATISDLSRLEISLPIEETFIAPVKAGQEVNLTFQAVPGRRYSGKVESISPAARQANWWENSSLKAGARYFMARVTVLRPDAKLRPGLQCNAQIVLKRLRDVLVAPVSAVVRKEGADFVYVRRGAGGQPALPALSGVEGSVSNGPSAPTGFVRQRVVTGDRNEDAIVITKGLRPGDVVALEDPTATGEK